MPYILFGFPLIFIGEAIRMYAVRYAGGVTRTMNVGAPELCTIGPYSRTRNPLYIGNIFIYSGVVFIAGGKFLAPLFLVILVYFIFQYSMIISLEEETLKNIFKEKYEIYCNNVPRLFPRLKPWKNNYYKKPLSLTKVLITEKRTLQNMILIVLLILLKNYF
ncbi:MAG: methyltransferase family protein [Candidatus Neomarinimicrobiota bacterium]